MIGQSGIAFNFIHQKVDMLRIHTKLLTIIVLVLDKLMVTQV